MSSQIKGKREVPTRKAIFFFLRRCRFVFWGVVVVDRNVCVCVLLQWGRGGRVLDFLVVDFLYCVVFSTGDNDKIVRRTCLLIFLQLRDIFFSLL
jgi:hypothetical protein